MDDLGVELQAVEPPLGVLGRGHLGVRRGSRDPESRRKPADVIAVAHPAACSFPRPAKSFPLFYDQFRKAVFPLFRGNHLAPQGVDHELQAVADPEDRDAQGEDPLIHPGRRSS